MSVAEQLQLNLDEPDCQRPVRRPRLADAELEVRGKVARDLVRRGVIDGWTALALTVWPGSEETLS